MQAVVYTRYGSPDVLELAEVPVPTPKPGEVLVRVHAVSINDWDFGLLDGSSLINRVMAGIRKPRQPILGSDVAGVVESAGERFRPGDEVFGDLSGAWGGFADYVCAKESALTIKPRSMTFEQAAAIPQAGLLAYQPLRDLPHGQRVLVNGGGGGVGTFAIQLARLRDAEVTAVDSAEKLDLMRSLGAHHVIDYKREDVTRGDRRFDVILDVRTQRSIRDFARVLVPGGRYLTVGGEIPRLLLSVATAPFIRGKTFRVVMLRPNQGLDHLVELFEAGKLAPIIDGPYPLRETRAAFHHFASQRHKGKIVIRVEGAALRGALEHRTVTS